MPLQLNVPYTVSLGYVDHRGYIYGTTMKVGPRDRIISFLLDYYPNYFSISEICDKLNISPKLIHRYNLKKYEKTYFVFEYRLTRDKLGRQQRHLYVSISLTFYQKMYQFLLLGGAAGMFDVDRLKEFVNPHTGLMYGFSDVCRDRDLVMTFLILNKTKTYMSKTIAHEARIPLHYVVEALKQLKRLNYIVVTKEPQPTMSGMRNGYVYRANETMIPLIRAYAKKIFE